MRRVLSLILSLLLLLPTPAAAVTVGDSLSKFQTNKVVTIAGVIDQDMTASVKIQLMATAKLPGFRMVLIRSPGGSVDEGRKIIKLLEAERAVTHQKLVCAVIDGAHSMAFSILTHCDVRLSTANATMVVHKVALGGDPGVRMSAKNIRKLADDMDKEDEIMAEENRAAMHLSRADYDRFADQQREWKASELIAMHYLSIIVTVKP